MNQEERIVEITRMILKAASLMRIEVDQLLIEGFIEQLNGYSTVQIGAAFKRIVNRDKWFPTVFHLLETLRELFPKREPLQLDAPPETDEQKIENQATAIIAVGFIEATPKISKELHGKIYYEVEFEKYKKEHWDDAVKRAKKDFYERKK